MEKYSGVFKMAVMFSVGADVYMQIAHHFYGIENVKLRLVRPRWIQ